MDSQGIDALVVPTDDPHMSEYVAPHFARREFVRSVCSDPLLPHVCMYVYECFYSPMTERTYVYCSIFEYMQYIQFTEFQSLVINWIHALNISYQHYH